MAWFLHKLAYVEFFYHGLKLKKDICKLCNKEKEMQLNGLLVIYLNDCVFLAK